MKTTQQRWRKRLKWSVLAIVLFIGVGAMYWDVELRPTQNAASSPGVRKLLIVGTDPGFKPFEYQEKGDVVGFDIDMMREVAKDHGYTLKIETMAFDGLIPALNSGKIDIIAAGMSITPERQQNVTFSKPYYSAAQMIVVRKDNMKITSSDQLSGKRIGVQLGTTGDTLAHTIPGASVMQFQTTSSVMQELNARHLDAGIMDNGPASQYLANNPNLTMLARPLTNEDYAFALRKSDGSLATKVNATVEAMRTDSRYENLIKKYFDKEPKS